MWVQKEQQRAAQRARKEIHAPALVGAGAAQRAAGRQEGQRMAGQMVHARGGGVCGGGAVAATAA
jgi:hypothetical protein